MLMSNGLFYNLPLDLDRVNDLPYLMQWFLIHARRRFTSINQPAGWDGGQQVVTVSLGWYVTPDDYARLNAEYEGIESLFGLFILIIAPELMNGFRLIMFHADCDYAVALTSDFEIVEVVENDGRYTAAPKEKDKSSE